MSYAARIHDGRLPAGWDKVEGKDNYKAAMVAIVAWEQVRGADPSFPACAIAHRERLIAEVEAMLKSGPPAEDAATPFTRACQAVMAEMNRAEPLKLVGQTEEGELV